MNNITYEMITEPVKIFKNQLESSDWKYLNGKYWTLLFLQDVPTIQATVSSSSIEDRWLRFAPRTVSQFHVMMSTK